MPPLNLGLGPLDVDLASKEEDPYRIIVENGFGSFKIAWGIYLPLVLTFCTMTISRTTQSIL